MQQIKSKKCKVHIFLFIMFLTVSTTFLPCRSFAGDMEILLDKLVNKGILTKPEADELLKEMNETKEMEKGKTEAQKPKTEIEATKTEEKKAESPEWVKNLPEWIKNPPEWIKNTKFAGDLRLRYQYDDREGSSDRNRGKFRWRLGAETKIIDDVTVGFGLASGSGDPRGLDQTFDSSFSKDTLNINYAFAQYKPLQRLSLSGGKLKTNPIFRANSLGSWPSELLWDNDITPEGVAVVLNYPALLNLDVIGLDVFLNNAFFILDENNPSGSGREPYMYVIQPGFNLGIMKDINFKVALAYYMFSGIKNKLQLKYSSKSNTFVGNNYVFDYNALAATAEFGFKNPFNLEIIPYVGLFGEYVYNPDPEHNNKGYLGGIRLGHPYIKKFGDWQLQYAYRRLEKDAWLDVLTDSTFYGGATNVKGHRGSIFFGLAKNLVFDINYFHSVNILDLKKPEDLLQVDIQFNF